MSRSPRVDQMVAELTDWRGETFAAIRKAILAADPEIVEEWKWMGSPVWSRGGLVAVGDAHKKKVKITFAHGAKLADPDRLFNGDDKGQTRRSIDYFEGDGVDAPALTKLVSEAIEYNRTNLKRNTRPAARAKTGASGKAGG